MRFFALLFLLMTVLPPVAWASKAERSVTVEWEPIVGAVTYDVEVKRKKVNDQVEQTYRTNVSTEAWTLTLEPGEYELRVRSRDRRKVPGDWSPAEDFQVNLAAIELESPANDFKLLSAKPEEKKVEFKWKPVPAADFYSFEIASDDGKVKITKSVNEMALELPLPVAKNYVWKVQASTKFGLTSKAGEAKFSLWAEQLAEPVVSVAKNGFVREISWTRPLYAEGFDYILSQWDPEKKEWVKIAKENLAKSSQIDFDPSWKGGSYRLILRAAAFNRVSSKSTVTNFRVVNGDRSPAAEANATLRLSINRTSGRSGFFGIASYLMTQMNYSGVNSDNGGSAKLKVDLPNNFGGTGRLGLGYLSENSPWGGLSILDLSGFVVGDSNPTFASLEFSALYRKKYGERSEVRHHLGLYYKELPELIAANLNKIDRIDKIVTAGPHYGVEYWYAWDPQLGFQANMHLYQSMLSIKTPNGNDQKSTMSYQLGLMGSYRLSDRMTGLAGYAYRKESAAYTSTNGSNNTIDLMGHYLNFFLEWAL